MIRLCYDTVPLAEGVQTGQDLRVVIVLQTNTADQELLVYLSHHRAGAARLPLSHGERHSRELKSEVHTPLSLRRRREKKERKKRKVKMDTEIWKLFQIHMEMKFIYRATDEFAGNCVPMCDTR